MVCVYICLHVCVSVIVSIYIYICISWPHMHACALACIPPLTEPHVRADMSESTKLKMTQLVCALAHVHVCKCACVCLCMRVCARVLVHVWHAHTLSHERALLFSLFRLHFPPLLLADSSLCACYNTPRVPALVSVSVTCRGPRAKAPGIPGFPPRCDRSAFVLTLLF